MLSVTSFYDAAIVERIMVFISLSAFPVFVASAALAGNKTNTINYAALVITTISFSVFFQQFFARPRPEGALLRGVDSPYSFPSTHSSSAFAWAGFMGSNYKKFAAIFYVFAVLVAVSRVYIGVHYPVDVAAGAVLGTSLQRLVIRKTGKPR